MKPTPLRHVWRIEGRANAFVPWVSVATCQRIEDAPRIAADAKARFQFYAVRVRVNF